jgi:hypothetical protein
MRSANDNFTKLMLFECKAELSVVLTALVQNLHLKVGFALLFECKAELSVAQSTICTTMSL